jgi:hypothetical protein
VVPIPGPGRLGPEPGLGLSALALFGTFVLQVAAGCLLGN